MTGVGLGAAALGLGGALAAIAALGDLYAGVRAFLGWFALAAVAYLAAVLLVLRRPPTSAAALFGILGAALLFRLCLLPAAPTLSTDLYRYLWDGRLSAAGVSPYRYPANAPELERFRDPAIYPRLNHLDWRTVYPPGAQLLFAVAARAGLQRPLTFKLLLLGAEALAIGLLLGWLRTLGRPVAWVLLYAWHPLVVVEVAGSGHLDAVVVAATVGALWAASRGREGWAGALAGVGGLVKLYPLLLLPALWRARPGRTLGAAAGVVLGGYALYATDGAAALGALGRYLAEEEFNGGLRTLLGWGLAPLGPVAEPLARALPLAGLALAALAVGIYGRAWPGWRRARWLVGGYLIAVPNLFPWYTLWMVPVLAVAPAWPWLYLTLAVTLPYRVFAEPVWHIPAWVTALEFIPVALGLAAALWPRRAADGGMVMRVPS